MSSNLHVVRCSFTPEVLNRWCCSCYNNNFIMKLLGGVIMPLMNLEIDDETDKLIKAVSKQLEKSGLSQKNIAKHFPSKTGGLTGCVWNWANGSNVPTLKQWKILKSLLDLSDEFLPLIERVEAERKIIGNRVFGDGKEYPQTGKRKCFNQLHSENFSKQTEPATPEAKLWNGWKSHGLKPAYEPIIVAMKPNDGTYANNALKHGVAGLNIDGGRIGYTKNNQPIPQLAQGKTDIKTDKKMYGRNSFNESNTKSFIGGSLQGRFPANIILNEEAAKMLDEQSGVSKSSGGKIGGGYAFGKKINRNKGIQDLETKGVLQDFSMLPRQVIRKEYGD